MLQPESIAKSTRPSPTAKPELERFGHDPYLDLLCSTNTDSPHPSPNKPIPHTNVRHSLTRQRSLVSSSSCAAPPTTDPLAHRWFPNASDASLPTVPIGQLCLKTLLPYHPSLESFSYTAIVVGFVSYAWSCGRPNFSCCSSVLQPMRFRLARLYTHCC